MIIGEKPPVSGWDAAGAASTSCTQTSRKSTPRIMTPRWDVLGRFIPFSASMPVLPSLFPVSE
jgi:hypothetical protein